MRHYKEGLAFQKKQILKVKGESDRCVAEVWKVHNA